MQVIWDCFCPTMQVIWDCFCPSNAGDTWSCWLQPLRGTLCTSHCLLLVDLMGPSCSGLSGQCLLLTAVAWTLCAICLVPTTFVGGFHCVQYAWYPLLLWVGFIVCNMLGTHYFCGWVSLCAICLVPTTFVGGFHCVQYAWYPLLLWVGFIVCNMLGTHYFCGWVSESVWSRSVLHLLVKVICIFPYIKDF